MSRLRIAGLTKTFGPVTALARVNLDVAPGEVVALVGESGAGKSTLARCIVGLVRPDAGAIEHDGVALTPASTRGVRRRAQLVFQDAALALDPRQRVGDAVAEARAIHGLPARHDLLAAVDLDPALATRLPHQLSGGQRHRVLLARALAVEPDLLLLDEPTAALDTLTRARILTLVQRLVRDQGLAALVITHDLPAAAMLADRLVVLERGHVVETGPMRDVIGHPAHPCTRTLVAAAR